MDMSTRFNDIADEVDNGIESGDIIEVDDLGRRIRRDRRDRFFETTRLLRP